MPLTYYDLLEVNPRADDDAVRAAFRTSSRRCHPDQSGDPATAAQFERIVEAYRCLSDPDRRRVYDAELARRLQRLTPPPPIPKPPPPSFAEALFGLNCLFLICVGVIGTAATAFAWHRPEEAGSMATVVAVCGGLFVLLTMAVAVDLAIRRPRSALAATIAGLVGTALIVGLTYGLIQWVMAMAPQPI